MKLAKKLVSLLLSVLLIASVFAIVPVAASAETDTITVFFTDSQYFGNAHVYAWNANGDVTAAWPGDAMTELFTNGYSQKVYGAQIPATATGVIFNGNGSQTGNIETGIEDGAWWYSDNYTAVALDNTFVAAKDATCAAMGNVAYYNPDGHAYAADLTAINDPRTPLAAHTLEHHDAAAATPTADGNVEYWSCSVCNKDFSDAEGTTEIADVTVPATGVATINGTPYTSLAAAVAAAEDGDTIKVIADCDAAYISIKGKAITINVASKVTVTGTQMSGFDVPMFKVASTGSLTLTGSGSLVNENDAIVNNNGFVKAGGPVLNGNFCAIYNGGTAQVTSGKLIGIQGSIINASQTATATISGGTIYGELKLGDPDAEFIVNGGSFDAQVDSEFVNTNVEILLTSGLYKYANFSSTVFSSDGTYTLLDDVSATMRLAPGTFASNVTLDLNGHTLTSTATDYAFLLTRNGSAAAPKTFVFTGVGTINTAKDIAIGGKYNDVTVDADVVINGGGIAMTGENESLYFAGEINTTGETFAISTNGSSTKNGVITIADGAIITSDFVGLFLPGDCVNTIGKASINAGTGIFTKSGTTTFDETIVVGNSEAAPFVHTGNGVEASTGNALVVESCGYPAGAPVITINNGLFISENNTAVASVQYGNNAKVKFFISGGSFSDIVDADLIADGYFCEVVKDAYGHYNVVPDTCSGHNFEYFEDDKSVACTICGKGYTGIFEIDGVDYYIENGKIAGGKNLIEIDGDYYYVVYSGKIYKNGSRTLQYSTTNGLVEPGVYEFGADGKMILKNGIIDGYWYEDGVIVGQKNLIQYQGDLYFVCYSGKIYKNGTRTLQPSTANGLVEPGVYEFDADGKMVMKNGIFDGYYYVNGKVTGGLNLIEIDGDYYFVCYSGKIFTNGTRTLQESTANGLVAPGSYDFDADGKLVLKTGVFDGYYYENGKVTGSKNVIEFNGDFYYVPYSGKVLTNTTRTIQPAQTNGLIAPGTYQIDADGKIQV